jgi:hypothetical protein
VACCRATACRQTACQRTACLRTECKPATAAACPAARARSRPVRARNLTVFSPAAGLWDRRPTGCRAATAAFRLTAPRWAWAAADSLPAWAATASRAQEAARRGRPAQLTAALVTAARAMAAAPRVATARASRDPAGSSPLERRTRHSINSAVGRLDQAWALRPSSRRSMVCPRRARGSSKGPRRSASLDTGSLDTGSSDRASQGRASQDPASQDQAPSIVVALARHQPPCRRTA